MSRRLTPLLAALGLGLLALPSVAATGVGPYYATPAWDQTLPAETRFVVLTNMKSEAVLDRETGLVWEREPPIWFTGATWPGEYPCYTRSIGGRRGWRLPTITELASLADDLRVPGLPLGHPFVLRPNASFWAITEVSSDPRYAYVLFTSPGGSGIDVLVHLAAKTSAAADLWCVRGR